MRESMADMETDRVLRIEKCVGALLMWIWGVWTLFHWHRQANRVTDGFVGLAAIGGILMLRAHFKGRSRAAR
jgi:hypothetical protein